MTTFFIWLLALISFSVVDLSYEINQPFYKVVATLCQSKAEKSIIQKNGGDLINKKLEMAQITYQTKGWSSTLMFQSAVRYGAQTMKFEDTAIFTKNKVTIKKRLIKDGGRLKSYLLITRLIRNGEKTKVEHELTMCLDNARRGIKLLIAKRIALKKLEIGIKTALGEISF